MLCTITIGTCVSVQGTLVRRLANGSVIVSVDGMHFLGRPVSPVRAA